MSWFTKLNKWKRTGIILSVIWALFAGIHSHNADLEHAKKSAKFSYDVCVQGKETKHETDLSSCTLERAKNYALYMEHDFGDSLIFALAPIPFSWLIAFILFYIIKAQIVGFRSAVPWEKLNVYKKVFVSFCVVFFGLVALFLMMNIMNMYVDTKVPVSLSSLPGVIKSDENIVLAEGTWTRTDLTDDSIMNPLQTSKIECVKQENHCYQSTASVSDNLLISDFDEYVIDSWTKDSIVYHEDALCGSTIYTVDLNTETVSAAGHETNKGAAFCNSPLFPSSTGHDHWGLLLTDGFKVYWEMHQKARPYLLRVIQSWFGN